MKSKKKFFSKLSFILGPKYKSFYIFYMFILFIALIFQIFAVTMIFPLVSIFVGKSFQNQYLDYLNNLVGKYFSVYDFTFVLIFTCILIIFANLIFLFSSFLSAKIAFSIEKETRIKLYTSYLKGNYLDFFNTSSSSLLNLLINETNRFTSQILLPLADIFSRIILAIGLSIFLFIQMPNESIIIILLIIFFYCLFFFMIRPVIKKNNVLLSEENKSLIKSTNEILKSFKEIKIYNLEDKYSFLLHSIVTKIQKIRFFTSFFSASPRFILEILIFILVIIFFNFNKNSFFTENLTVIAIFFYCIFKILPSIQGVFTQYVVIKSNSNAVHSLYDKLLTLKSNNFLESKMDYSSKLDKDNNFNSLEIVDYKFNYPDKLMFSNLNFQIKRGQKIGIIGPSGTGKTTFLNLLTGLLLPVSGKYMINGKNYDKFEILPSIKNIISFVPQSMSINENSIKENILLDKKFDEKKFNRVVEISKINEFINNLKNKFDTKLHSSTSNLSGGQIQRIALARALYRKPKLLIIDEGFNQLDHKLEETILEEILEQKDLSILMVYHKIVNFNLLDEIYEISENKLNRIK